MQSISPNYNWEYLLTGDKFTPELHLKQPGFSYSACWPFTKHPERIKKFREAGNLKHFCRNELEKACFAHDATYSDSKDLANRTISDKIFKDKAYEIARNCGHGVHQKALASMVYKFFDKKTESGISLNGPLAKEVNKPAIENWKEEELKATFGQQT